MHIGAIDSDGKRLKRKLDTNDDKEENMKYKGEAYLPMVVNVLHAPKNGESGEFIARHSLPENSPLTSTLLRMLVFNFSLKKIVMIPKS